MQRNPPNLLNPERSAFILKERDGGGTQRMLRKTSREEGGWRRVHKLRSLMGNIIECHFFARNKRPQAEQPRQQTQRLVASCLQYPENYTMPFCQFAWRQQAEGVARMMNQLLPAG
jgi:hypothetical protein